MLRLLGNIDNAKRLIQLELDFPAKVQPIHVVWNTNDKEGGEVGGGGLESQDGAAVLLVGPMAAEVRHRVCWLC